MGVKVYFDMDGTVFDLYGKENWLELLETENPKAFVGSPMPDINMKEMEVLANYMRKLGVEFGVITWLPRGASDEYMAECTKIKKAWVEKYMPYVTEFNAQPYGTPKQYAIQKRCKKMILIDDNIEVCKEWATNKMRTYINVSPRFNAYEAMLMVNNLVEVGDI